MTLKNTLYVAVERILRPVRSRPLLVLSLGLNVV